MKRTACLLWKITMKYTRLLNKTVYVFVNTKKYIQIVTKGTKFFFFLFFFSFKYPHVRQKYSLGVKSLLVTTTHQLLY